MRTQTRSGLDRFAQYCDARSLRVSGVMDGSTPLLCLVRWLRIMDDRHHEPTGMTTFECDRDADGQHQHKLVATPCIKRPIVLHPYLEPDASVYNHFLD